MEETKQKNNKMKWIIIIIAAIIVAAALVVFLGKGDSSEPPKEKEYVKEDQIGSVFSDPDKFKDKYIKLKGQVFNVEENDGTYSLQVWYDVKNFEKDFIVDTDQKFEEDDYISIDGWITGSFTGESAVGGEVTCPRIQAVSAEETNYIDVAAPTVEEKTVNKTSSQYGVDVTIEKIEFAKDEVEKGENVGREYGQIGLAYRLFDKIGFASRYTFGYLLRGKPLVCLGGDTLYFVQNCAMLFHNYLRCCVVLLQANTTHCFGVAIFSII